GAFAVGGSACAVGIGELMSARTGGPTQTSGTFSGDTTALASGQLGRYGAGMEWRISRRPVRLPAGFIEPCNPTFSTKAPSGRQWIHEIKHDGYRLIVRKDGRRIRLFTRRGFDWSDRYPAITIALQLLRVRSATIDGEAI